MEFPKAAELKELVSTLAPGLIILGIRQWFMAGSQPDLKDRALGYAIVSAAYYATVGPLVQWSRSLGLEDWTARLIEYAALPILIGLLAGMATNKGWAQVIWKQLGVQPVHHVPTAWDYALSRVRPNSFLLVTLSDGSTVGGLYGEHSFASSKSDERDVLIGRVYNTSGEQWEPVEPPKSILLCGKDIRFIEFINGE